MAKEAREEKGVAMVAVETGVGLVVEQEAGVREEAVAGPAMIRRLVRSKPRHFCLAMHGLSWLLLRISWNQIYIRGRGVERLP